MKYGFLRLSIFFLVIVAVALLKSFMSFTTQEKNMKIFLPHMNTFMAAMSAKETDESPYIRGKVVTIDIESKTVDYMTYTKLSDAIKAKSPDEVGTVVYIKWGWEKKGVYKHSESGEITGEAFKGTARVSAVDIVNRVKVFESVFEGDKPAEILMRDGDHRTTPVFRVVDYIEKLPRV